MWCVLYSSGTAATSTVCIYVEIGFEVMIIVTSRFSFHVSKHQQKETCTTLPQKPASFAAKVGTLTHRHRLTYDALLIMTVAASSRFILFRATKILVSIWMVNSGLRDVALRD